MEPVSAASRVIQGQGTCEAQWQAWPALHALPQIGLAGLVPVGVRAVIVAPHPDDEVLASGGLIAMLAARGDPPLVIGVTDGDASHPGSTRWSPEELAAFRHEEALTGLGRLGIEPQNYLRLSLPDGRVQAHHAQLVESLVRVLRAGDAVLSTWAADGHPDHEATALAVSVACAAARCPHWQSPVWLWHWAAPGDRRVPWAQLRRLRLTPDAQRRKHLAVQAHASQLTAQDNGAPPVLAPSAVQRLLRPFEYFFMPLPGRRAGAGESGA
ncbi:MAG: PIG-L family deacetylase [Polaromonas sp.]|nr:PIG-L family deacetylase [Polaromonas sp.]